VQRVSEERSETLQLELEPEPSTPRAVRREFTRRFEDHPCLEILLLCLSEVVTNAVLHARTPLSVTVSVAEADGTVRVEVADRSHVEPVRRRFADVSPTGRGLHLLDRLTTDWGIEPSPTGKTVWFEIAGNAP
jgi:anti-sigma regulatory factor (Ser/Thr protein kinase)